MIFFYTIFRFTSIFFCLAFPPVKRTHSAHRQAASIKNGEQMIEISTLKMRAKEKYFGEKIRSMQRVARMKNLALRINIKSRNTLMNPWPRF